ncbi:MAG: hypothetical protein AABZ30_14410 [Myxococcota bacterium]
MCRPLRVGSPIAGGFRLASIDEDTACFVLACGDRRLAVRLDPRDDAAPRFAATATFNLVYLGVPGVALARDQYQALLTLSALLRRSDRGEPLDAGEAPSRLLRLAQTVRDAAERPELVALAAVGDEDSFFVAVETAARLRPRKLVLHGEDPLARPRLLEAAGLARKRGVDEVEIVTPPDRLADRVLADLAVRWGVTRFRVVFDQGGARAVEAAARTLETVGGVFDLVTPATRRNLAALRPMRDAALRANCSWSLVPANAHGNRYRDEIPSHEELLAAITGVQATLVGFPPCVAERVRPAPRKPASLDWHHEPPAWAEPCDACSARPRCPGVTPGYLSAYGSTGLRAVP